MPSSYLNKFKKGVAPVSVIRKDFEVLRSSEKLFTSNEIQDVLFVQSLEGRAHNGSGVFNKRTYVNTTIDDVVKALNRDPDKTKAFRQSLIDDVFHFVENVINDQLPNRLINADGEPFFGVPLFKDRKVNARDVLRGLYMGGLRDNAEIRKQTEERYKVNIGCGECCLVDIKKMVEMGLDGEQLAHEAHEKEIEYFTRKGLIIKSMDEAPDPDDIRYYYIRHRIGPGQSDDAAVIVAGILYNYDVALGVFLSDAIDTLEKYAPIYQDQDQDIAYYIGRAFKDLQITMDDVYELCYLCSIPVAEEEFIPDSSLRYLLAIDQRAQVSAIESHLNFIEGKTTVPVPVSFKRVPNGQFYNFIKKRLINVRRLDRLAVPDVSFEAINRPLKDVVQRNFLVVKDSESLPEVVRKFRQSKSEILIVEDKKGTVLGTLTATDLIELSGNGS